MPSVPCPGRSARRSSVTRDPLDVRGRPRCPRPPRARVERFRRLRDTSCGCSPSARPGTRPFRRNALVRLGPSRDRLSLDAVSHTTALPHRSLLRHRIDDQDRSVVAWNDPGLDLLVPRLFGRRPAASATPIPAHLRRHRSCRYTSGRNSFSANQRVSSVGSSEQSREERKRMPLSSRHGKRGSPTASHSATIFPFPTVRTPWHERDQRCPGAADPTGHRAENEGAYSPATTPTQPSMLPTSWRVDPPTEFPLTRWTLHSAI